MRAVALDAALVDVPDEQVRAALVAELADLSQQMLHRHGRIGGTTGFEVAAVRVDERGPVLRCPAHPFGLVSSGVPLDGVQRQTEPAGAVQQTDSLVEEVVDLVPALDGGLGTWPVLQAGRLSDR